MKEHQSIEPTPLRQLQMRQTSLLYDVYLEQLMHYSRSDAILRTKNYLISHFPVRLDEQIVSLEFLYMNDFYEELEVIVASHYINDETKHIYETLLGRTTQTITTKQLNEWKSFHFSHPWLHCLHLFTLVYFYHDLKVFTALDKYLDDCEAALQEVNEPLMYYYLNQRYQELLFHHFWKTDNSILANRHAYKMVNTELSPRKKTQMYHNLALCNLYNGFDSAIEPLTKSLEIAEEYDLHTFIRMVKNQTLPFISAFHQKTKGVATSDPVEHAHLALARGDNDTATRILKSISDLSPFQESYLGLATQDTRMLKRSYQRFIHEQGDHFFARVPLEYLKRMKTN